jgi:hypothetical protein
MARLISPLLLLLLLLLLHPLLWLEEFDLLKGVKPGLILTSPQTGLTQDMVVSSQGCQMRCRVEHGMDRSKRKHLFTNGQSSVPLTPLIPTLSGPSCAPPKHWQISGLDGATATCHSGGDSDNIVCDNVELQDPEHQLDGGKVGGNLSGTWGRTPAVCVGSRHHRFYATVV